MKIIITGSTGMIGEGVLLECLANPAIESVLSVSRKGSGKTHPKLKEYIVKDFLTLPENDANLRGYDAIFFCAGVSSVGMDEATYYRQTYETTIQFAKAVGANNTISFMYVSGGGTDSTEKGRMHWARVKGKTENDLAKMGFKQSFGYRIGMVEACAGQVHVLPYYKYLSWIITICKVLAPNIVCTMKEIADSMIYLTENGFERSTIFVKDIHQLSKKIS
ncbi:MAG: hypothetical protein RL138_1153 [Bacteroidota bacterium]|jgi:uncharacterized protein YbjT (DUF2867 family)